MGSAITGYQINNCWTANPRSFPKPVSSFKKANREKYLLMLHKNRRQPISWLKKKDLKFHVRIFEESQGTLFLPQYRQCFHRGWIGPQTLHFEGPAAKTPSTAHNHLPGFQGRWHILAKKTSFRIRVSEKTQSVKAWPVLFKAFKFKSIYAGCLSPNLTELNVMGKDIHQGLSSRFQTLLWVNPWA